MPKNLAPSTSPLALNIYCDGGSRSNPGPAACAFVVLNPSGQLVHKQGFYLGQATNNLAEYAAVTKALEWIVANRPESEITFYLDSQLVVNQLQGSFKVKDQELKIKNMEIKKLIENCELKIVNYVYIPRIHNSRADLLVNETLDRNLH